MPDKSVAHQHHATFEGIRHVDDEGNEFWLARPLGKVLDYSEYRHFLPVVERARERFSPEDCAKLEEMLTIVSDELMPELDLPKKNAE